MLAGHDRALARLERGGQGTGAFVLGAIENLVDPILPNLIAATREHVGDRPLQLRVDRSFELAERLGRGEVDAALVVDLGAAPGAIELGTIPLRWRASPALPRRPRRPSRSRSSRMTRPAACATSPCSAWTRSASSRC